MIEETAVVVAADRDGGLWVEAVPQSACGGCVAGGHCGTGALGQVLGRRPVRLKLEAGADAAVGDRVVIGLPEGALLRGAVMLYLVPLLMMFAGAVAAAAIWGSADAGVALAGGAGMLGGLGWARRQSGTLRRRGEMTPVLLRRALSNSAC